MKKLLTTLVVSLLLAVGAFVPQTSAASYCGISWGSLPKTNTTTTIRTLKNIRAGQHQCYDRLVFDLNGAKATGYRVEYVKNVYAEGSGKLIPLAGGAKLRIVVYAPAYNSAGKPTYPGVVGKKLPGVNLAGYQTFRDARYAGSFEGQTTVGLGVRNRLPFRVFTTGNRIVVDVAHRW